MPCHGRCTLRQRMPVTGTLRGRSQQPSAATNAATLASSAPRHVCARARVLPQQARMADDSRVALRCVAAATSCGLLVSWVHSSTQLPPPWNHVSDVLGFTYTAAWSGELFFPCMRGYAGCAGEQVVVSHSTSASMRMPGHRLRSDAACLCSRHVARALPD